MSRNLFAYGSLMCEDILGSVAGCAPAFEAAVLKDYRRLKVRGEHYPGLVRHPGGRVDGMLYHALQTPAWVRLDRFEGVMYERVAVSVNLADGTLVEADTYLIRPESEHRLEPVEWDFELFLAHGKEGFVRDYAGYEAVRTQSDT
jgi:gamma-glutamylcyclotransferase (GGCT)/AIG2-like uncharacterized protein YtfP